MFLCFLLQKQIQNIKYFTTFVGPQVTFIDLDFLIIGYNLGLKFSFSVEDLFESVNEREIRQVFEGQNRIHLEIKQLHRQLAMILDEQRRYVSVITDEIAKKGTTPELGQVGARRKSFYTKWTA